MALTEAEAEALARVLDDQQSKVAPKERPNRIERARRNNITSLRHGWSLADLRNVSVAEQSGVVIDITDRLPKRRGKLRSATTKSNLRRLLKDFGDGKPTVTQAEKEAVYEVVSAHMEANRLKQALKKLRADELHEAIEGTWEWIWLQMHAGRDITA